MIYGDLLAQGQYKSTAAAAALHSAKDYASGVLRFCSRIPPGAPGSGRPFEQFGEYCNRINRISAMSITQVNESSQEGSNSIVSFNDQSLEGLFRDCSQVGNLMACSDGCDLVSEASHPDHRYRDLFCRLSDDPLTSQGRTSGLQLICANACRQGGHSEDYFTCQIGSGNTSVTRMDDGNLPVTPSDCDALEGHSWSTSRNRCIHVNTERQNCLNNNNSWDSTFNRCDDLTASSCPGGSCETGSPNQALNTESQEQDTTGFEQIDSEEPSIDSVSETYQNASLL